MGIWQLTPPVYSTQRTVQGENAMAYKDCEAQMTFPSPVYSSCFVKTLAY